MSVAKSLTLMGGSHNSTRPGDPANEADAAADSDTAWVEQARGGDPEALERLLQHHAPAIYRLCHYVAGPRDGRDAAQRAMERIVINIDKFDARKGSFRTWALTVARNVCRDRLRRRKLERAAFQDDPEDIHTGRMQSDTPNPERAAIVRNESFLLQQALETLPENMRSAIVLFHVHEASYEEIAQSLDVPMGTVMTWLHRGRKKLRQWMEDHQTPEAS